MFRVGQVLRCASSQKACLSRAISTTSPLQFTVDTFQRKKIMAEFDNLYDINKDGYVDLEDIESLKKKLVRYAETHKGEDDIQHQLLYSDHGDFWKILANLADENRDGKLSREEWLNMWTEVAAKEKTSANGRSLPQWFKLMPPTIFPVMDYKGDGLLDMDEYKVFWKSIVGYDADDSVIERMYNQMTENGKRDINLVRFGKMYADYYLSADKEDPANFIAGPVEYC